MTVQQRHAALFKWRSADGVIVVLHIAMCHYVIVTEAANATVPTNSSDSSSSNHNDVMDTVEVRYVLDQIVPIVAILLGPLLCVFGYRLWLLFIISVGFLSGGLLFAVGMYALFHEQFTPVSLTLMTFAFLIGAVVFTWILVDKPHIGTFAMGGTTGVLLASLLTLGFGGQVIKDNNVYVFGCMLLILVFGTLFLQFERVAVIIFTSFFGAYALAWGIGHFTGDDSFWSWSELASWIYQSNGNDGFSWGLIPWSWWAYASGIVAVATMSIWLQWTRTGRWKRRLPSDATNDQYNSFDDYDGR